MLDEVARPQGAELFPAERDEHDRACRFARGKKAADLEQRGGAGRIVVGAVMDASRGIGVERPESALAQVIVVGAHNDEFATPLRRGSRDDRDDIARGAAGEARVEGSRGILRDREVLERCLESCPPESFLYVGGGTLQPGRSDATSLLGIVREEPHVGEYASCRG